MSSEENSAQMGATVHQRDFESRRHQFQQQQGVPKDHITCVQASQFAVDYGDITDEDPNVPSDN